MVQREANLTRSVPLLMEEEEDEEKEEEREEAREEEEGGIVAVATGLYVVAMPTKSPWIFIKNISMKLTLLFTS